MLYNYLRLCVACLFDDTEYIFDNALFLDSEILTMGWLNANKLFMYNKVFIWLIINT